MLKRLLVIVVIPCMLYGWGADFRVTSSDTSQGLISAFTMNTDFNFRVYVFLSHYNPPYYLRVFVEDSMETRNFREVSTPCPIGSEINALFTYPCWDDSGYYVVAYTPSSTSSKFWFIKYARDYSWALSNIRPIDNSPNDNLTHPQFKVVETQDKNIYLFVSCIKETESRDSAFIFVSEDSGRSWIKVFCGAAPRPYRFVDFDIEGLSDTPNPDLWCSFVFTNDTLWRILVYKIRYDTTNNNFNALSVGGISDANINSAKLAAWPVGGILAYDANGVIKVQKLGADTLEGSPITLTDASDTNRLIGVTKGYEFGIPRSTFYYGIAYTYGGPVVFPNSYPVVYRQTDLSMSFSEPETLNNFPCDSSILTYLMVPLVAVPAIAYTEIYWHWTNPPIWTIDSTVLYMDVSYVNPKVRENSVKLEGSQTILTSGRINLNLAVKGVNVPVQIALYSIDGRCIRTVFEGVSSNKLNLSFDILDLAPGLYFVQEKNGRVPTVRIIKQ